MMMTLSGLLRIAGAAILVLCIPAGAEPQSLLVNGSFESYAKPVEEWTVPGIVDLGVGIGSTDITGWTVVNGPLDYCVGWEVADSVASLDLGGNPGAGGISQTFSTSAGETYRVTFAMSGNPDPDYSYEPSLKTMRVDVAGLSHNYSYDTAVMGNSFADMMWQEHSFQFIAESSSATLLFINTMGTVQTGPVLDDVKVVPIPAAVPTLNLLGLAVLLVGVISVALWLIRRRITMA